MSTANRPEQGATILDHLAVIYRYRMFIVSLCLVAIVATLGVSLWLPKVYRSTATVLVPRESGPGGFLGSLASSGLLQQIPVLSLPSLAPNRDMLLSILKSQTVALAAVDRFGLQQHYRVRYSEDAVRALQRACDIAASKEGVVSVRVEDTNSQLAADIANFYVETLDRLVTRYGTSEAGRQRGFITEQLARAKVDLAGGEGALRRFQERNRAVVLQEQTRGAIDAAARLKGEIIASEVQMQVMRNFATESNPEVVMLRRRIEEMKHQLAQMEYGEDFRGGRGLGRSGGDFSVPFAKVPEIGLELVRLTREVKIQETLVTLLTQQVEQAKIAEARDLPMVQSLDRAIPPIRHARPKLMVNIAIAGVSSFLLAVTIAFAHNYVESLRRQRSRA